MCVLHLRTFYWHVGDRFSSLFLFVIGEYGLCFAKRTFLTALIRSHSKQLHFSFQLSESYR